MNNRPDFLIQPTEPGGFNNSEFPLKALALFRYQYRSNPVYQSFCDQLRRSPASVQSITDIPYLPIGLFKTHPVVCGDFQPEAVFTSSGTTGKTPSQHQVERLSVYRVSFLEAFRIFYGDPTEWCILALLPSYLERSGSSLAYMTDELIRLSGHPSSGFFLYDTPHLHETLQQLERQGQQTLLLGVTFALMDFAATYPIRLQHTTVMETGGMKGRRQELAREEVHSFLQQQLGVTSIHSEYGMTELLSQAYAPREGLFQSPPWMQVLIRSEDDPLAVKGPLPGQRISGPINIIDLANQSSCAFIATDDLGTLYPDGRFEVVGRIDHSDVRGCSLLYT